MKSLAICILILTVVGLATCAKRHRRQAAIPEGAIPAEAGVDAFMPLESPLNLVVGGMISKAQLEADDTGVVDMKKYETIKKLGFVIQMMGDSVSQKNQEGMDDLDKRVALAAAAAGVEDAPVESTA